MGLRTDRAPSRAGQPLFQERLEQSLAALGELLVRPSFTHTPATVGAELEMFLVGPDGAPVPRNEEVRAAAGDRRLTVEVNRFNLEANLSPVPLGGRPFTALHTEVRDLLDTVSAASALFDARPALTGTLPTLGPEHLTRDHVSDVPRFEALERAFARDRGHRFPVVIDPADGGERCTLYGDSIGVQGAACSWQVHLTAPAPAYTRLYNAAQLATGPALAAAVNSPLLFGRPLWQETRVPLYEQGFGDRAGAPGRRAPRVLFGHGWLRHGARELFEDAVRRFPVLLPVVFDEDPRDVLRAGGTPRLEELRLHQSTVWRWNRPVYDPCGGGHLRIEFRALPSGPTAVDMVANTAFLLGLTLSLAAPRRHAAATAVPFALARENFYRAARRGMDSRLWWPGSAGHPAGAHPAGELLPRLVPEAAAALTGAGVAPEEAGRWLSVIADRVRAHRTAAWWQGAALRRTADPPALLRRYLLLSAGDRPVHTWPTPSPPGSAP